MPFMMATIRWRGPDPREHLEDARGGLFRKVLKHILEMRNPFTDIISKRFFGCQSSRRNRTN